MTLARTRGRIAKSFWSSSTTMTEWVGDDREVVVGIVVGVGWRRPAS